MRYDEFEANLAAAEANLQAMASGMTIFRLFFEEYFHRKDPRLPHDPTKIWFVTLVRISLGARVVSTWLPGGTEDEPVTDYTGLSLSSDFRLYVGEVCLHPRVVFARDKSELQDDSEPGMYGDVPAEVFEPFADTVEKLMNPITSLELLSETLGFHLVSDPYA